MRQSNQYVVVAPAARHTKSAKETLKLNIRKQIIKQGVPDNMADGNPPERVYIEFHHKNKWKAGQRVMASNLLKRADELLKALVGLLLDVKSQVSYVLVKHIYAEDDNTIINIVREIEDDEENG